jgi:hypothetical protein
MHLAQVNIAALKYPLDDPRVAGFVNGLDLVNGIAERSDGFVWRLMEGNGDADDIGALDDPMVVVNLSVWRDPECLERFVWQTVHKQFYRRRAEWFSVLEKQHLAMWWVDEGHHPTLGEAKERLEYLDANGSSDFAFGWSYLPHVKLWQQARCA